MIDMLKLKTAAAIVLISVSYLFTGCGTSPEIVESWRDPDSTISFNTFRKVLVIAALDDDYNRKFTENRFAARLGDAGVKSYELFNLADLHGKKDYYIQKFTSEGFDGAVVLSKLAQDTYRKITENLHFYYDEYWDFTDFYTDVNFYQGRMYIEERFYFGVNVYSFKNNKMVWYCITKWENPPSDLELIVKKIADEVGDKMREDNFIIK